MGRPMYFCLVFVLGCRLFVIYCLSIAVFCFLFCFFNVCYFVVYWLLVVFVLICFVLFFMLFVVWLLMFVVCCLLVVGWWLVVGGWWLVVDGGWWLVVDGGWWLLLVVGRWLFVVCYLLSFICYLVFGKSESSLFLIDYMCIDLNLFSEYCSIFAPSFIFEFLWVGGWWWWLMVPSDYFVSTQLQFWVFLLLGLWLLLGCHNYSILRLKCTSLGYRVAGWLAGRVLNQLSSQPLLR